MRYFLLAIISFTFFNHILAQQQDTAQVVIDSIVLDDIKERAIEILKDSLNNHDSNTNTTKVVNKVESIATETINNETDININGIPKDSTEIANKSEQLVKEKLNIAGIEINGFAKFLEMQAIVSYNFLHDNSERVYNSPVVFKTGLRVTK